MNRVQCLVVDSGPFIKGAPLQDWSETVYTIRDVISEIKDGETRQRLQVLPYELLLREPSHESVRHVTEFSKKTGDYQSLSAVDIRLMALTYQLERELGPQKGTQLRSEPVKGSREQQKIPVSTAGFYSGRQHQKQKGGEGESENLANVMDKITIGEKEDGEKEEEEEEEEEEGEDGNWITPDNLHAVCDGMGGAMEDSMNHITVGCLTTDYAMQNVLLQIGLNVISIEGMLIKRLRTYAQQCKACFRVFFKSGLLFCPHCGNKSMIKVLADTSNDGITRYTPLSDKQFSHKGLRYSLPLPKGGRRPDQLLLSPSQKLTFRLPRTRNKPHPLDPDYIGQASPFSANDVTSRGAQIAFRSRGGHFKSGGAWHRNPNQVRKGKK